MLLWLRAVQTTLFWTVRTVLFKTNQMKLQVASAALGALVWKLYLRGQNLRRKGNLREKITQPELPKTSGQRKGREGAS